MKKQVLIVLLLTSIVFFSCKTIPKDQGFHLSKIVFHSTRCFGWCPVIDMQVDSAGNMIVRRAVFPERTKGGEADSTKSGMFKSSISKANYDSLVSLLVKTNIDSLKFPDQMCCDAPVVTLIVYHNHKRKYLKSMFPPEEAQPLMSFLKTLALDSTLQKVPAIDNIEE